MRKAITLLALVFIALNLFAQTEEIEKPEYTRGYIGFGMGLDFGGFGLNLMGMPSEHLGFFAGAGYNLVGLGFNGGARLYFNKQIHSVRPYLMGMYGYNAVIKITGAEQYNKTFYGATFGFGMDIAARNEEHYWTIALNVPIRGPEVDEYTNSLKSKGIQFSQKLLPVAITIGYRIGMGNHNGY